MHLRQNAVAAFNRRGGALKNFDPGGRPRLPLRKDVGSQPLRDGVLLKRCPHRFQCLLYRIFTQAIFSYLIVNKRIKCYFRENPSGYKSLTLEKSTA